MAWSKSHLIWSILALSCFVPLPIQSQTFRIVVRIQSTMPPHTVTIQGIEDLQPKKLDCRDEDQAAFFGNIALPLLQGKESKQRIIRYEYDLIGRWPEEKIEQLYLAFGVGLPKEVQLFLDHEEMGPEVSVLEKIESYGSDFDSQLKRYFHARNYHKIWRHEKRQPYHDVALRGAKVWFDASIWLSSRKLTFFRMDTEIADIMIDYEKKAEIDHSFRRRYRKYVNVGYVASSINQTVAAPFSVVGEIPSLIQSKSYDEALQLNGIALDNLMNQSDSNKEIILKFQKINIDLLKKNESYILALKETRNGNIKYN
jgi:hypothetical protein